MDDASTATVGDDSRIVPGASPGRKAPRADTEPAPTRDKAKPAAKPKPTKADKPSRKGRGKAKADTPPTPAEVIKAKRRRCADAEDIAGFFTKLIAIVVLIVLLFGFLFGVKPMENDDMAPRISAGDLLFYYRLADDWVTGDVMVFEKDGEQYVGRIVANPGDTVEVTDQATLVVNGSTVLENDIYYTTPQIRRWPRLSHHAGAGRIFHPMRLPRGRPRQPVLWPGEGKRDQGQGYHRDS